LPVKKPGACPSTPSRFAENGITFAALRHLTDQDLKDIGVLLGHRRIMLAAIGELGTPATTPRRCARLAKIQANAALSSPRVQNVQNVQNSQSVPTFEHFEQFEQP
jgi:SAM domain (Sterile alpha motif)